MMALNRLPIRAAWQQAIDLQERFASLVQFPELPATPPPAATMRAGGNAAPGAAGTTPAPSTPKASQALSVTLTVIRPPATASPTAGATTAATSLAAAETPVEASPTPAAPSATPSPTPEPATATPAATSSPDTARYYTVRPGDTFIDIGNATGIPWEDIAAENGMTAKSLILPGTKLRLPRTGVSTPASPTTAPTAAAAPRTYRVQAGDTLMAIGNTFGISWQSVAQANGLTAYSVLQVGQELIIPAN
jgi:lysozyme